MPRRNMVQLAKILLSRLCTSVRTMYTKPFVRFCGLRQPKAYYNSHRYRTAFASLSTS